MTVSPAFAGAARLLALIVALAGIAACRSALPTVDVESARIAARVTTALVNDPGIGTRLIDVRASQGGIVSLSGRVRSEAERARAVELAQAVPGVTRVESRLRIGADVPPAADAPPAERERTPPRDPAAEFSELEPSDTRVALGASFGWGWPTTDTLESGWSLAPLVRIELGPGLAPALTFDWYGATFAADDASSPTSHLRVRPVMAGVAYTVVAGPLSITPSLVGGYAFNHLEVPDSGGAGPLAIDVSNSLAWRPGVAVWIDSGRRTSISASVGRVFTRPTVTYIDGGVIGQRSLDAHATVVSVGLAYRLF